MLKKIGIAAAVLLVVLVGVVAMQPATFRVERSLVVNTPADVLFDQVNTMKNRQAWYPWDKLDPNMKRTYSGPESGVGASYAWSGNDDVGSGEQTIRESVLNQKVVDDLHFITPFEAQNVSMITFAPEGTSTRVTWAMEGKNAFMGKAFSLVMDMDSMVGKDFEQGLASLAAVAASVEQKRAAAAAQKQAAVPLAPVDPAAAPPAAAAPAAGG